MDILIQNGIDWILVIQSLGNWLKLPMQFFTFLGQENFFFLVLPLVYWSIGAGLGLRIAFILTLVVFSFQISKVPQDVGGHSVIIPSLRQFAWEILRIHDPRARRTIT